LPKTGIIRNNLSYHHFRKELIQFKVFSLIDRYWKKTQFISSFYCLPKRGSLVRVEISLTKSKGIYIFSKTECKN